jgi:hypothetical protein
MLRTSCKVLAAALAWTIPAAVQSFNQNFDAALSKAFDPKESKTFKIAPGQFDLSYADGTKLAGFVCNDYVQLGEYFAKTDYGCITHCNSPDFNGVDGIVGFGLPPPKSPNYHSGAKTEGMQVTPDPLLFALTDQRNKGVHAKLLDRRIFSFLSTEKAGELQLGGVDPASIDGTMWVAPTILPGEFAIPIVSIKYGAEEILQFALKAKPNTTNFLPAIVDSGSSCLVLPDTTFAGRLLRPPYRLYKELRAKKPKETFYLSLGSLTIEIPWDTWYLPEAEKACVQKTPPTLPAILLGDVLFRRYVVMFNLTDTVRPLIGIGKQAKGVKAVTKPAAVAIPKLVLHKKSQASGGHIESGNVTVDDVPVINKKETQYFIKINLGTPRKDHVVTFDTGSSVFGIFSKSPPSRKNISMFDHPGAEWKKYIVIGGIIGMVAVLSGTMVWYFTRNMDEDEYGEGASLVGSAG